MVQRHVVVPADAERLWRALTDPEEAGAWLGGKLEWTVEEGGPLRFTPNRPTPDEPVREGQVEVVEPGRYLRFRWWPTGGGPDAESSVAYVLEPAVDDETVLTVEETPAAAVASGASPTRVSGAAGWGPVDDLQFRMSCVAMSSSLLIGT